jgi:hypothetical protein
MRVVAAMAGAGKAASAARRKAVVSRMAAWNAASLEVPGLEARTATSSERTPAACRPTASPAAEPMVPRAM